jgi:diguanylate cyclase (GGDEF)-like protein
LGVIFIDLDEFKELNDTLGHDAGDVMLKTIAQRFINCARKSDTVSRRGGDEFTILMPRIKNIEDAIKLAERILDSNKNAISIKDKMVFPKTSIGISIYPRDGDSIETLINNADKAMYNAKESGKNQYSFYNSKY